MEHIDLFEDVALAVLVASTTVATLDVRWRSGQGIRWWPKGRTAIRDTGAGTAAEADATHTEADGYRESLAAWLRRLASEQARCVRHRAPATVVALRVGPLLGALGRRSVGEIARTVRVATNLAGRSRGSDVVRVTQDGIVRILLVETSEDGARAYVERISTTLAQDPDVGDREVVATWASMRPTRDLPTADRLAVARLKGASGGWLRSLAVRRSTAAEDVVGQVVVAPDAPGASPGPAPNEVTRP